jgi:hypothetical protein
MGIWPIGASGRLALRLATFALSPIVWITVALLLFRDRSTLWSCAIVLAAAIVRARIPRTVRGFAIERAMPLLPGHFGAMVSHHLREMLTVLDTWLALVLAAIATAWRVTAASPDPAAWPILSILVGIALSTWAQCGAGLDSTRYRLYPIHPRRILLARDAAYLAIQAALTAPLSPIAGLTFGMTALAVGRYTALHANLRQSRWRFASGRVLVGAAQMILGAMLAFASNWTVAIAAALWLASLAWGGLILAQRFRGIDAGGAPRR